MADSFDYAAARAAGMTPTAIQQFLDDQLAAGHEYQLPSNAFSELRAARLSQGQAQGTGSSYRGPEDSGNMSPGVFDPGDLPLYLTGGRAGIAGAKAAAPTVGRALATGTKAAGGTLARGVGGMITEAALEHFIPSPLLRTLARGGMAMLRRSGGAAAEGVGEGAVERAAGSVAKNAASTAEQEASAAGRRLAQHRIEKAAAQKVAKGRVVGEIKPARTVESVEKRISASQRAAQLGRNRAPRRGLGANQTAGAETAADLPIRGLAESSGLPPQFYDILRARGIDPARVDPAVMEQFLQQARAAGLIP